MRCLDVNKRYEEVLRECDEYGDLCSPRTSLNITCLMNYTLRLGLMFEPLEKVPHSSSEGTEILQFFSTLC